MLINLRDMYKEAMNCTGSVNSVTDTEYRLNVDHKAQTIILSFQGSSKFIKDNKLAIDWRDNFKFWVKPYKNMKHTFFVHRGLLEKYQSVRDEIWEVVKDLKHYKMIIVGFSQGGGLTLYAHEDYWFKGFNPESYPFAAPMVFTFWNRKILKERFKKCHTVFNRRDIVPNLPGLIFGFIKYGYKIPLGKWKPTFPWQWYKEHMGYKELI